jgi:DNA polymerase-4
MLKRLDVYTQTKVVYIELSASNFTNARLKSFDLLNIEKDRKMASLLRSETKLRDKYGIDIVRMAGELI